MVVWNNKSCFPFWRKLIHPSFGGCYQTPSTPLKACCSRIASRCYGSSNVRKPKGPTTGWIEPIEPKNQPKFFNPKKSSWKLGHFWVPPWLLGYFWVNPPLNRWDLGDPFPELRPLAEAEPPSTPAAKPRWKKVGDEKKEGKKIMRGSTIYIYNYMIYIYIYMDDLIQGIGNFKDRY